MSALKSKISSRVGRKANRIDNALKEGIKAAVQRLKDAPSIRDVGDTLEVQLGASWFKLTDVRTALKDDLSFLRQLDRQGVPAEWIYVELVADRVLEEVDSGGTAWASAELLWDRWKSGEGEFGGAVTAARFTEFCQSSKQQESEAILQLLQILANAFEYRLLRSPATSTETPRFVLDFSGDALVGYWRHELNVQFRISDMLAKRLPDLGWPPECARAFEAVLREELPLSSVTLPGFERVEQLDHTVNFAPLRDHDQTRNLSLVGV